MNDLFGLELDDDPTDDYSSDSPTPFTFYPHVGPRTVGRFQAEGLMTKRYPLVSQIDEGARYEGQDKDAAFERRQKAIHGIPCQGYNTFVRCTLGPTAQHHDAQAGLVTAAHAGAWAAPCSSAGRKADKFLDTCRRKIPHVAFSEKIRSGNEFSRDLRLENIYYANVNTLPERARNWRRALFFLSRTPVPRYVWLESTPHICRAGSHILGLYLPGQN